MQDLFPGAIIWQILAQKQSKLVVEGAHLSELLKSFEDFYK